MLCVGCCLLCDPCRRYAIPARRSCLLYLFVPETNHLRDHTGTGSAGWASARSPPSRCRGARCSSAQRPSRLAPPCSAASRARCCGSPTPRTVRSPSPGAWARPDPLARAVASALPPWRAGGWRSGQSVGWWARGAPPSAKSCLRQAAWRYCWRQRSGARSGGQARTRPGQLPRLRPGQSLPRTSACPRRAPGAVAASAPAPGMDLVVGSAWLASGNGGRPRRRRVGSCWRMTSPRRLLPCTRQGGRRRAVVGVRARGQRRCPGKEVKSMGRHSLHQDGTSRRQLLARGPAQTSLKAAYPYAEHPVGPRGQRAPSMRASRARACRCTSP
jgi:hypothetical protein